MKAAMYYNNNDVRIEEMPRPVIGPGELLVKVASSGICGSDVLEWYRLKKAPLVLGHEIAGIIEETGNGVTKYKKGDRVFVSHHIPCNTCRYCLSGNHTVCETLHTTNFFPGGFAEYLRVPPLNVDRGVFILPEEISFDEGVFIEPLACVIRGQRISRLLPGESVAILGSGISGLLHLVAARAFGAGRIIMTDISPYRLKTALDNGADAALDARKPGLEAELAKLNGGRLFDQVIISTGAISAFKQALKLVDRGGKVLFFAAPEPGVALPVPVAEFWRNGITLLPSYGNSPLDAVQAIELIRSKRVMVDQFITHRLGLAEAAKGFQMVAGAGECVKVVIKP
ncbi:MAG: alcohol dehydrogenase catalytic domain-containing protein [Candidatus Omnitrophica bacterium]|nr:alcohol dehydrogenase catalytic domain-containing protein [Candidatus Omnitrophota bacterium]